MAKPTSNMCLPPLSWQTYDVDFSMAKFDDSGKKIQPAVATVKLNGVTIHNKYEIPKNNGGRGRWSRALRCGGRYLSTMTGSSAVSISNHVP